VQEFQPPVDRQIFVLPFVPLEADFDENGHVNNVLYLGWVQTIATAHWRSRIPAEEQGRWAWVLIDTVSGRPTRVPDWMEAMFTEPREG
jgi:acyl-CoA thioesterase FadM